MDIEAALVPKKGSRRIQKQVELEYIGYYGRLRFALFHIMNQCTMIIF